MEQEKNVYYQIRIDEKTKKEFMTICKEGGYNSSAIMRQLMQKWIADHKKK